MLQGLIPRIVKSLTQALRCEWEQTSLILAVLHTTGVKFSSSTKISFSDMRSALHSDVDKWRYAVEGESSSSESEPHDGKRGGSTGTGTMRVAGSRYLRLQKRLKNVESRVSLLWCDSMPWGKQESPTNLEWHVLWFFPLLLKLREFTGILHSIPRYCYKGLDEIIPRTLAISSTDTTNRSDVILRCTPLSHLKTHSIH